MEDKLILYFDLDGVLADLKKGIENHPLKIDPKYKNDPDDIPGIFKDLPLVEGSKAAIKTLDESNKFEMFILSTSPWDNPSASNDKKEWVEKHFGELFYKKLILSHRKDLLMGDYLVDDRTARGADKFQGEHLHFGFDIITGEPNKYPYWSDILDYLLPNR